MKCSCGSAKADVVQTSLGMRIECPRCGMATSNYMHHASLDIDVMYMEWQNLLRKQEAWDER